MAIPEGWTLAALGDVARLQRGFDLPATVRTDGEIPVIASNGVVGSHNEARVRGPGVVTGRSGTIGKVFFIAQDFWPLNTTLYVEDFHGNEPQFIAFFLRHIELGRFVAATGVPSLNRNFVHPLEVILPPLPEQKKIAAILSSVDETIAKTESVISQLQIVKKAMMEQLLTKGMPCRHTRFKQTEIGEIPEEWEVVRLGELVSESIRNGYSPQCPNESTGKWTLSLGAVGFDGFNPSARKPAPLDDLRVDASALRNGDLLLSRSNTRERVGLVGIYRGDPVPCSYPDLLMRIRLKPHVHAEFLEATLLSNRGRTYFEARARGTSGSMVKVDRGIVEQFIAVVPSLGEQQMICKVLRAIDEDLAAERHALLCVQTFKQTLSSSLLSGEIRVAAGVA